MIDYPYPKLADGDEEAHPLVVLDVRQAEVLVRLGVENDDRTDEEQAVLLHVAALLDTVEDRGPGVLARARLLGALEPGDGPPGSWVLDVTETLSSLWPRPAAS